MGLATGKPTSSVLGGDIGADLSRIPVNTYRIVTLSTLPLTRWHHQYCGRDVDSVVCHLVNVIVWHVFDTVFYFMLLQTIGDGAVMFRGRPFCHQLSVRPMPMSCDAISLYLVEGISVKLATNNHVNVHCWGYHFSVILETWKCQGILQRSQKSHKVRERSVICVVRDIWLWHLGIMPVMCMDTRAQNII